MTVRCLFKNLYDTVDLNTAGAVEEALQTILDDNFTYKGISATFKGMALQVDLLD